MIGVDIYSWQMVRVSFRMAGELQDLLGLLKENCSAEDYRNYAGRIAQAIDAVNDALLAGRGDRDLCRAIARVEAGDLSAEEIWTDMVQDMPNGLPKQGDRGLDRTPTWGRTYWGGAMFCLLADIEIRKQTGNTIGLQQALRGIVAAGGTIEQDWPIERIFSVGRQDHRHRGPRRPLCEGVMPYAPDLDALWRDLGVLRARGPDDVR
jgi:hypothetical protein